MKTFLKSKPLGIEYSYCKMILWLVVVMVFAGLVSLIGVLD